MVNLSDMSIQQEFHRETLPADGTPVETGRMAGEMKLKLELRAATRSAEDAARRDDAGCRGRTSRSSDRTAIYQGRDDGERRRVYTAHVGRHLGLAPEEAPAVAGVCRVRPRRRVLVVGQGAYATSVDPTLLAVLDREVHLYRHLGVERVPAQSATVQMMRVGVQQVSLKLIRMRVELLARAAREFLADLTEVVFGQMGQHVLAGREDGLALGTQMLPAGYLLVAVVGLQVPGHVLAKGLEILERGVTLTAQQGVGGVASGGIRGCPGRTFVREIGGFQSRVSASRHSGVSRWSAVVNAVQLRLAVIYPGRRRQSAVLAVLENVVLGVGRCRGARNTAQRAYHHRRAEAAVHSVYR